MQGDVIFKFYWDLFLSHICEFYPLSKAFIDKYEYELDWTSISKSKVIAWDTEFLDKYQDRFLWEELAWNDSISWTIERVEKFKKRLDWYYLGRNKNLPITEEFIKKFSKQMFVADNNSFLTNKLKRKYDLKIVPGLTNDTQTLKRINLNKIELLFRKYEYHHNQHLLYKKVFLPLIEKTSLEKIFTNKFDYTQRYYFLEPIQDDIHGLTPEFEIIDDNPFKEFRDGRGLFETEKIPVLKNGSLQEGPDRLYEIPRFPGLSYYATLLVSENIKAVLEKFKLPGHIFHPVKLIPKKLSTLTKYFILHLEYDTLTKDLDHSSQDYFFNMTYYNNRNHGMIERKISNFDEFVDASAAIKEKLDKYGSNLKVFPNEYKMLTDYDVYSYSVHGEFIINQFVKNALEKNFPKQIAFRSAQLLNIKIDQKIYNEKIKRYLNTPVSSKLTYKGSEDDKFYYAKMERLESFDPPLTKSIPGKDRFSAKETELNVIFPDDFKNQILEKKLKIKGYDLLPIKEYYLENQYADRYPETYKSVVVAENGIGDSVNLILQRDSDFRLQRKLFEFFHETGEYEEIYL